MNVIIPWTKLPQNQPIFSKGEMEKDKREKMSSINSYELTEKTTGGGLGIWRLALILKKSDANASGNGWRVVVIPWDNVHVGDAITKPMSEKIRAKYTKLCFPDSKSDAYKQPFLRLEALYGTYHIT